MNNENVKELLTEFQKYLKKPGVYLMKSDNVRVENFLSVYNSAPDESQSVSKNEQSKKVIICRNCNEECEPIIINEICNVCNCDL